MQAENSITYCSFSKLNFTIRYTCYKTEICCDEGCCIKNPYQVYQMWYYWLVFLILFCVVSGGGWLCKRPRTTPRSGRNQLPPDYDSFLPYTSGGSDLRDSNNENRSEDIVLDRFFVSFRNKSCVGDPPSYTSILSQSRNNPQHKLCPLFAYYGPPPTYSSVFQSRNTLQNEENNNAIPSTSSNVTQIQVHVDQTEFERTKGNPRINNSGEKSNENHENANIG